MNHVLKQILISKGIFRILSCASLSVSKKVRFSIAYSHLQYGTTAWGGAAAKYLNKIKV